MENQRRPSIYEDKVLAVERLVQLFKLERTVYIAITGLSFAILIIAATVLLLRGGSEPTKEVFSLFLSSGGILYSTSRLLKMWSEAMKLLLHDDSSTKGEK